MKMTDRELNNIVDDVTAEIRSEKLDSAIVEGAAQRVWTRMAGEQAAVAAGVRPVEQIRNCDDFQALIPAYMPWNFPFWQVFRFAAPALMAGNVCLLKHASNVPQCALAIEEIFRRAGFPEGAFQTLLIGSDQVGRALDNPRVMAVTLTGSAPFIVMPSADIEEAAKTAVRARVINNGQSCIAAKRFIVAEEIADEFERRFVEGMESLKVGDPMDETTDVGPLATKDILETLEEQVRETVAQGGRILTGGERLMRAGNYFAPTVLTDIPKDSPGYLEEMFGPVASLFRVRDLDEAIRLANDTTFGLAASAWTNDDEERSRLIDEIDAGLVFINAMVASDPRLPFGGVKSSGYGRELSREGIREFVNIKTVWIKEEPETKLAETE